MAGLLFRTQRGQRIDACCAPSRNCAGKAADERQRNRDTAKDGRIMRRDAIEERRQKPRHEERSGETHCNTDRGDRETVRDYETDDATRLRAERDANGDITSSLRG